MPGNGGEGGGEADVQRPRLLCEHLEAAGVDEVGIAVEQEQPPGRRCGAHGVEHVGERRQRRARPLRVAGTAGRGGS